MTHPRYPSLYRINTLRQSELAAELGAGRPRWDDIRDQGLDFLTQTGFDLVWFPGVWQTGPAGHKVSLPNPRGYLTHICLFKREGEVTA